MLRAKADRALTDDQGSRIAGTTDPAARDHWIDAVFADTPADEWLGGWCTAARPPEVSRGRGERREVQGGWPGITKDFGGTLAVIRQKAGPRIEGLPEG